MRLYIAGSISNGGTLSETECLLNIDLFNGQEARLAERGYEVRNPARRGFDPEKTWLDYMRDSLRDIADSDGIAVLPNWSKSHGAKIEVQLAKDLGIPVKRVVEWLDQAS